MQQLVNTCLCTIRDSHLLACELATCAVLRICMYVCTYVCMYVESWCDKGE